MKIASILATTAIVLAAAAGHSVEAANGNVARHGGHHNAAAATGTVHASDRQQLVELLHRNHPAGSNFALTLAQWLKDRAAASPAKRSTRHVRKQPASHGDSDSDSDSGSDVGAHVAGHPHRHPHKLDAHKQSALKDGSEGDAHHNSHKHNSHKQHGHHYPHHSASSSGSGSGGVVGEVTHPHRHHRGTPASILHLDGMYQEETPHEKVGLHAASGSSSIVEDKDMGSEDSEDSDSEDIEFPSHSDEDADDSVDSIDSVDSVGSIDSIDSVDSIDLASSTASTHGDVDVGSHPATSTPEAETSSPETPSPADDDVVVVKPHLPHLRNSDSKTPAGGEEEATRSSAKSPTFPGATLAAPCVVAGLVGVIAAAVGYRRVRRSDARYGASELIVDLPDPEAVGDEGESESEGEAASALTDAPASTTNALDEEAESEADDAELTGLQSPFPRADEVGEFTNA